MRHISISIAFALSPLLFVSICPAQQTSTSDNKNTNSNQAHISFLKQCKALSPKSSDKGGAHGSQCTVVNSQQEKPRRSQNQARTGHPPPDFRL